jgi:hypothetical protein
VDQQDLRDDVEPTHWYEYDHIDPGAFAVASTTSTTSGIVTV